MRKLLSVLTASSIIYLLILQACENPENIKPRVFILNSYHPGYGSSDDIMQGIRENLDTARADFTIFYMDTKRKPAVEYDSIAHLALQAIQQYDPDIILATDDNAVKYVIEPYFKGKEISVLFAGVNWSAEAYGLPTKNITGMLEVIPVGTALDTLLNYYPQSKNIAIISEKSNSAYKDTINLQPFFEKRNLESSYFFSADFQAWKEDFIQVNQNYDLVYFPTNGAIANWKDDEASQFVQDNISTMVFTCDDFMMPYAVFGLTKIAQEQGEWLASTTNKLLSGELTIAEVDMTRNHQSKLWLNNDLAKKISFQPSIYLTTTTNQ